MEKTSWSETFVQKKMKTNQNENRTNEHEQINEFHPKKHSMYKFKTEINFTTTKKGNTRIFTIKKI